MSQNIAAGELGLLEDPQQSLRFLSELEELGEEILMDRQEIVALDRRRNDNRQALRSLLGRTTDKTWMAVGSLLIKLPQNLAKDLLTRDQIHLDVEVNKLRSKLKVKVNKLRDMEHKPPVPGLLLNPLSREEMSAVNQVLGGKS